MTSTIFMFFHGWLVDFYIEMLKISLFMCVIVFVLFQCYAEMLKISLFVLFYMFLFS
jgi:hypothetical protein